MRVRIRGRASLTQRLEWAIKLEIVKDYAIYRHSLSSAIKEIVLRLDKWGLYC